MSRRVTALLPGRSSSSESCTPTAPAYSAPLRNLRTMASATQRISLQLPYAAQSFLAFFFSHRNRRGPRFALLVGPPRHHSRRHAGLVDRLSFRLVLIPHLKISRKTPRQDYACGCSAKAHTSLTVNECHQHRRPFPVGCT